MNASNVNRLAASTACRQPLFCLALALGLFVSNLECCQAAIETRETLKTYFETGDVPTQEQFSNLIDSLIHYTEDRHLLGLVTLSDGKAALLPEGMTVGPLSTFAPVAGLSDEWAGQLGFAGLAFTENSETHYGYLQIRSGEPGSSGAPGGPTLYPMFVAYFVFESLADTPIVTSSVPEPSTLVLGVVGGLLGLWAVIRRGRV